MTGLVVLEFFPVLNCIVAMEMLLIFPVPTGYLIPLTACKPFKWRSITKSIVVLRGHVQRVLRYTVVSPTEGGFMFEACSCIDTLLEFLSGELWE